MDTEIQNTRSINKRKNIKEFIIDETLIKIGSKFAWLWVAIEDPMNKQVIHIDISFERTMLIVAERFIASLINKFGKHPVSTADGGIWYPQACHFLKLKHHIQFLF